MDTKNTAEFLRFNTENVLPARTARLTTSEQGRTHLSLSSLHGNEMETVRNKNDDEEQKWKQKMKSDYNTKWGGADLHDQLQVYYSIDRKGVKWWRRVLCEMSVLNSFILHNLVHGKSRQIKKLRKKSGCSLA